MNNQIGVLIVYNKDTDLVKEFNKAKELNLQSCQLSIWNPDLYSEESAERVNAALKETGFEVSAVWAGWSGGCEWNFTYGPATIGLVPVTYRLQRYNELLRASDFAERIGVNKIITHVGFIPENPDDPKYSGLVGILRTLCRHLESKGQYFLFETGQETPVTMLRTIQAIGTDNIGINFDTANLILYGKANSVDALEVFGKYVMNTHIKDGNYPTDGLHLGLETPAGEGKANFPGIVKKLKELNYQGPFTIEREISGEEQIRDIEKARDMLLNLMAEN